MSPQEAFVAACQELEPSMPTAVAIEAFQNNYHDVADAVHRFRSFAGRLPELYALRTVSPTVINGGRWKVGG